MEDKIALFQKQNCMNKQSIVFGILIIIQIVLLTLSASYISILNKNINTKTINIDIHDREDGICADMYKEGFDWGYGQVPLQINIWRMEGKSESLIKELLYDIFKSNPNNN